MTDALSLVSTVTDPTLAPRADLERFRTQILTMSGDLYMETQLATQLVARYGQALKE